MDALLIGIGALSLVVVLWLSFLATLAIKYDHALDTFQKTAQLSFVWLVPILGASFVLYLVFEHSPQAIPRSWIPWPLKSLVFGRDIKPNPNRANEDDDGIWQAGSRTYRERREDHGGGGEAGGGGNGGGD